MAEGLAIDADRLGRDLTDLARIGRVEGAGIHRRAFSEADTAGRQWFVERLQAVGAERMVGGHTPQNSGALKSTYSR